MSTNENTTRMTEAQRTDLARALHRLVYAPGADFDRSVPGIQEYMLGCADKVAAALPWLNPEDTRPVPPVYLAADLWDALGAPTGEFDAYYERNGWADTWANLLGAVRDRFKPKCGQDADGESCVLSAGHLPPHYGASDVGSSEPVPLGTAHAEHEFCDARLGCVPQGEPTDVQVIRCEYCGDALPSVKDRRDVPTTPDLQRLGFDADKVVCPECVERARPAGGAR